MKMIFVSLIATLTETEVIAGGTIKPVLTAIYRFLAPITSKPCLILSGSFLLFNLLFNLLLY
jgi:hypothetical protein